MLTNCSESSKPTDWSVYVNFYHLSSDSPSQFSLTQFPSFCFTLRPWPKN